MTSFQQPIIRPQVPRLPVEEVPSGEDAAIDGMIGTLKHQLTKRYPKGVMRRDAHPKHYALVDARVTVDPGIPGSLRHGVFRTPGVTFEAKIRFSSGNPIVNHDLVSDLRGFALKIFGATGPDGERPRFNDAAPYEAAHDFVMATGEAFFGTDAVDFVDFPRASENGFKVFWYFVNPSKRRFRGGWQLLMAHACPRSPLDAYYFSQTPYRLGPHCVKYQVRRTAPWPTRRDKWYRWFGIRHVLASIVTPLGMIRGVARRLPGFNVLRHSLQHDLKTGPARLEFLVQRWPDLSTLPVWAIENATRQWSAPWERVATIEVLQDANISQHDALAERIDFTPWRSLTEHQPLGSINRARLAIYWVMSAFRRRHSGDIHRGRTTMVDPVESVNDEVAAPSI